MFVAGVMLKGVLEYIIMSSVLCVLFLKCTDIRGAQHHKYI